MKRYRVWQMETVIEKDEDYREFIVQVTGTPFGVQDTILDEEQLDDLRRALNGYMSSYQRPIFFYQEIGKDPTDIIYELIEKGKTKREEQEARLKRFEAERAKHEAQAEKRKKERERKKYEKLKAKFEGGES